MTTPDITMLPVLADFFQVSVDELLGLVPLKEGSFIPEETDSGEFWNEHLEYLLRSRKQSWNADYLQFLVREVWRIDHPVAVLDCGCGYGYMAPLLMPLLPDGSTYTGVDFSEKLISYGRSFLKRTGIKGELLQEDFYSLHTTKQYDVVLCQSVLRHIGDSHAFISRMIEMAASGALLICIDSNRELECAGLYIDGMDYEELCDHAGAWKHWKAEKEMGNRDYAAAMQNAFVMRELGLRDIEVRMNDKMSFIYPEMPEYDMVVDDFIGHHTAWYQAGNETSRLMSHGMTKAEAEKYSMRSKKVAEFCEKNKSEVKLIHFRAKTIAFGWKK